MSGAPKLSLDGQAALLNGLIASDVGGKGLRPSEREYLRLGLRACADTMALFAIYEVEIRAAIVAARTARGIPQ